MGNCVLKTTWHTFKAVSLVQFLTDDNRIRRQCRGEAYLFRFADDVRRS